MWKKEALVSHQPLPRSGFAGVSLGNKLVFFGGNACSSGENFLSDTYVIDTETGSCAEVQTSGEAPCAMDRHSAVEHKNAMWVFGGDRGWTLTNKLWKFQLDTRQWQEFQVTPAPCARRGHTAVKSNARGSMVIFGGMVMAHAPYYLHNRLVTSNMSVSDTWECSLDAATPTWKRLGSASGAVRPASRRGHSCVMFDPDEDTTTSRMYVFGGYCEREKVEGTWFNDLWRFTMETDRWEQIRCWGAVPAPRVGHCAVQVSKHSFLVFGGGTLNNNENSLFECHENGFWRQIDLAPGSVPPTPRSYASCAVVSTKLYLHGGCDTERELNCMYSLDLNFTKHQPRSLVNFVCEFIVANDIPYRNELTEENHADFESRLSPVQSTCGDRM